MLVRINGWLHLNVSEVIAIKVWSYYIDCESTGVGSEVILRGGGTVNIKMEPDKVAEVINCHLVNEVKEPVPRRIRDGESSQVVA